MTVAEGAWTLALLERGERARFWPLSPGVNKVGRDAGNSIRLVNSSVSREHAEIVCERDKVLLRDLKSRNGVIVNGVARTSATLQPGDRLKIGIFEVELLPNPVPPSTVGELPVPSDDSRAVTIDRGIQLPEGQRELYALYHICSWLTEGIEDQNFSSKCLRLIVDAFGLLEAHLYDGAGRLEAFATKETAKPVIKLGEYLAKQFQEAAEPVVIPGSTVARHQQRVGQYNYLVGPLRPVQPSAAKPPILVLLRPVEWVDFTGSDRVFLQAICQLWVRSQSRAVEVHDLRRENAQLKQKVGQTPVLGASPVMEGLRERARKAGATNATVLLLGETGSGKEVVAQLIHESSSRKDGPFIKVNCGAIPDSLIESELFGHVQGAFTDARQDRKGKFAQADRGTIFLDEIGEMPLFVQAKVLRAVENGELEPLGSDKVVRVNVRIIAATHRDLKEMVREKQFRQDLYYRLGVVVIAVPPLREHLSDAEVLAAHFLEKFCLENGLAEMRFAPEALAYLQEHNWPGNVRELRNVVQRCAAGSEIPVITLGEVRQQMQMMI
jgi:hypothetical protein